MNLQFGCGGNHLEGFRNHDIDVDITKPLPYPDACADFVFIEHCLEHEATNDGFRFLLEAHRILKIGGTLRICVPELARLPNEKRRDIICNHGHKAVFCAENLSLMLEAAGFDRMKIMQTGRKDIDSHHRVIGLELDTAETLRMEATK